MSQTPQYIMIYSTFPDKKTSDDVARALVAKKLAACVQRFGPIQSTYNWKGTVNAEEEWLLLIKTKRSVYAEIESVIQAMHPYETPEILAVPVIVGSQSYLDWMDREVSGFSSASSA